MKKSNIKLMSALLTLTLSGSSFCLTSCTNGEKGNTKIEDFSLLGNTEKIDEIFTKNNIRSMINELQTYGVSCEYTEKLNSLEVNSLEGYDFSELPDRFYTLFNDLLRYTSVDHLCCFSKDLAPNLDLSKLNLEGISRLGLFGKDDIINYVNSYVLNLNSLYILLDETSLATNRLNLNVQGITEVTVLSGNSNVIELGNVNFSGAKESELILSGFVVTNQTSFNCNDVTVNLTGSVEDATPLTGLKNIVFEYRDNETGKKISYIPNISDIDEIVRKINSIKGVKSLKKENI